MVRREFLASALYKTTNAKIEASFRGRCVGAAPALDLSFYLTLLALVASVVERGDFVPISLLGSTPIALEKASLFLLHAHFVEQVVGGVDDAGDPEDVADVDADGTAVGFVPSEIVDGCFERAIEIDAD